MNQPLDEVSRKGIEELRAMLSDPTPSVNLQLTRWQAYCLIGQLQLAFRHPQNTGRTRRTVEEIARRLEQLFANSPALSELLRRGWKKEFDR